MILTFIVIPMGLMAPLIFKMITNYTTRLIWSISLPIG
jgi:hypothetical protein